MVCRKSLVSDAATQQRGVCLQERTACSQREAGEAAACLHVVLAAEKLRLEAARSDSQELPPLHALGRVPMPHSHAPQLGIRRSHDDFFEVSRLSGITTKPKAVAQKNR